VSQCTSTKLGTVRLGTKPTHLSPLAAQRTKPKMTFSHLATDAIFEGFSGCEKPVSEKLRSGEFSVIQCPVIPVPERHNIVARCAVPVGNDAIQLLEKSASKLLICNEQNFGCSGLRVFDAWRGVGKKGSTGITDVKNQNVTISHSAGRSILVSRKEPDRLSF
jgi:hypothetical protein